MTFRRDTPARAPEVRALILAIEAGDQIYTTGLVLQELLQGFSGPRSRQQIIELRNQCRRHGIQLDTIDALLGQLCIRHGQIMLTADKDFHGMARHSELRHWQQ